MELTEEQLQQKIAEAVNKVKEDSEAEKKALQDEKTALEGEKNALVGKNKELLGEKKKVSEQLKLFGDLDPERVKKMMSVFQGNEEAKLIADGKIEEVIQARLSNAVKPVQDENEALKQALKEKEEELSSKLAKSESQVQQLQTSIDNATIDKTIARLASADNVHASAIEDIQRRARDIFSVNDDSSLSARDPKGNLLKLNDEILTPEVFIKNLKKTSPHYWPASSSGNLSGSAGDDDAALEAANKGDVSAFILARRKKSA